MRFIKKGFLAILFLFNACSLFAQKEVTHQKLAWYAYSLNLELNEKLYFQTEFHERHFIDPTQQHQALIRSHLHKVFGNTGWEISAGMCAFYQSPNDPNAAVKLITPELRPHIEFAYKQKLSRISFDHRYRAEARFFHNTNKARTELEDGYTFGNYRFRYRLQATIPVYKINDDKSLRLKVSDEIHINAGEKIVKNIFEQNRIYVGLSFDVLKNLSCDVGYLNWYQQRPTGDFYNRNILSISVAHKIALYKKASE